jgi:hypothetical protein
MPQQYNQTNNNLSQKIIIKPIQGEFLKDLDTFSKMVK